MVVVRRGGDVVVDQRPPALHRCAVQWRCSFLKRPTSTLPALALCPSRLPLASTMNFSDPAVRTHRAALLIARDTKLIILHQRRVWLHGEMARLDDLMYAGKMTKQTWAMRDRYVREREKLWEEIERLSEGGDYVQYEKDTRKEQERDGKDEKDEGGAGRERKRPKIQHE